jgi:hypothetical protein
MNRVALAIAIAIGLGAACDSGSMPNGDGGGVVDLSFVPGSDLASTDLAQGVPMAVTGMAIDDSGAAAMPVAGASVSIVGTGMNTTTAADGSFTLMANVGATIFVRVDAAGYQSLETGAFVLAGLAPITFHMISQANVAAVTGALAPPLTVDTAKGAVLFNFDSVDNNPGYSATISAAHGMSFVPESASGPMYATSTTGQKTLVFPNVTTGTTTYTIMAPGGRFCMNPSGIQSWRVDANVFTVIDMPCQ